MNALAAAITILAIGDSISAGPDSYYQHLPETVTVVNKAIPGSTYWDWLGVNPDCVGPEVICGVDKSHWIDVPDVDIVHVMLGGNDATRFLESREWNTTEEVEHIALFLSAVRTFYPEAVLMVSTPLRIYTDDIAVQFREAFLGKFIALGAQRGYWKLGFHPMELLPSEYTDGLHPNADGKKTLAYALMRRIMKYLPTSNSPTSSKFDI